MAKLDEYWNQIQQSESFQDLDDTAKEKVRTKLFDRYVQSSDSYLNLPQSQRIKVKQHFDDMTKIKPEGFVEGISRRVKKVGQQLAPAIQKGKEIAGEIPGSIKKAGETYDVAVELSKKAEPYPVRKTYEGLTAAAGGIRKATEKVATVLEPNFIKPELTDFDVARAVAAGSVRTSGEFVAGLIPTDPIQVAMYPLVDSVLKYAGTTFLGKEIHFPRWKPKTGLSTAEKSVGSEFEKLITKRRIENNARKMTEGPPKPLEVLAHKEQMLKTQDELAQYEDWLKKADALNERGGEPVGDIHPEAKVNVSQLRDAAKERLEKLRNEPVRIESLSGVEDELRGYFRRRISDFPAPGSIIEMGPSTIPKNVIPMLPEPPQPAGLLKSGETIPERPVPRSPVSPPSKPVVPEVSLGETGTKGYKDFIVSAFKSRLPNQTKQAIDNLAGSLIGALKDQGFLHPTKPKPLNVDMMNFLDQLVDQATKVVEPKQSLKEARPSSVSRLSEDSRLRDKGIDPADVRAEAKRLQTEHNAQSGISQYEQAIRENGGIAMNPADPSGKIPEQEEYLRNVPTHLRGRTTPDQMAQALFDAGLQEDASTSTMYKKLAERKAAGQKRSAKSFLDEAEYRLESEMHRQAGFSRQPTQETIPGTPPASMPKTGLGKTEGQIPDESLLEGFVNRDNEQRSMFDIISDISDNLGEKGQIGGEIDPVKKAALEANLKELVDRAMSLGYDTTQDIMLYAAKNAPKEIQEALRKQMTPTLSPFDTHAYKEMEEAKKGNPIAKKSLMDRAMREYLQEKYQALKGYRKARKASQIIGQFHDGDEALMRLKNDLFIHDNLRTLDANEAAATRWVMEGKAPSLDALKQFKPEEEAKAMLEKFSHPTESMKKAIEAIRPFEDEWHDLMSEFYDSLGYAENYVTRRWKQPREYLNWEGKIMGDRVPFVKKRKLISHADGINAGYEPRTFDIRDDIRAANDVRTRLLTRLHDLRKIATTFDDQGRPSIMLETPGGQASKAKITVHSGKAPDNWLRYQGVPLLRGVAINPDYKPAIDFIFGSRYRGLPIELYEQLGSLSKASILGYSLFHPASLTEMLLGGVSYRDVFTFNSQKNIFAKIARNFVKASTADLEDPLTWKKPVESINKLYKSFMSGHAVLANRPLALDMAEHGFRLGSVDDVNYNILSRTLTKYENWLKARAESMPKGKGAFKEAAETVKGIREAGDLLQKFMWDYQRPLFSMALYENHLADNIKVFNLAAEEGKKIPIDQLKFSTANMVSKMVGGISMGTLLVSPRAQQFLQWAMMAPDWTIGRAMIPAQAVFGRGPEGRQARKLMLRLGVSYFVFGNLLNYHNSEKNTGKGRFMWENDPGHENEIMWKKDSKGRQVYFQPSKAFTEIYDDLMHPAKTAAYKLNPNIHAAVKMFNWATSGTYPTTLKNETPLETVGGMFMPRTFSGLNAYGTFPVHKGISRAQVMDMFEKYYKTGNAKFMDQAMRYGMESGFDVSALARAAKARHTGQVRRKEREALLQ